MCRPSDTGRLPSAHGDHGPAGADLRRAAWLTLAAFVVSAVALGLRPQLFGMVLLALVLLVLALRRDRPRLMW